MIFSPFNVSSAFSIFKKMNCTFNWNLKLEFKRFFLTFLVLFFFNWCPDLYYCCHVTDSTYFSLFSLLKKSNIETGEWNKVMILMSEL